MSEKVIDWFNTQRGIRRETLAHFGVTVTESQGQPVVHLPYTTGEKTRKNLLAVNPADREFYFTKGVKPPLYNEAEASCSTVFLVEGETDTMRLWQELHDDDPATKAGVVGLSGINTWRPELAGVLGSAKRVFVILDNDQDYNVAERVNAVWKEMRTDLGATRAKRLRLPDGVKDVCEFFDAMDLETLRLLAKRGGPNGAQSKYRPLDLSMEPPAPQWLLDGLVAKGDVTLLTGPPGVGKSWFTMGLTTAVTEGRSEFLGQKVLGQGRVLYVDQENPNDVIYHRLRQLGLGATGHRELRYLWNQGIRIDRNPDDFLEEALDFSPELIILDSLTRLHTQDENSAGAMSTLFNEGIQPLARETGAAVLLIHHTNKSGGERGSIDIVASVDAALKTEGFGEENPGKFLLKTTKSRRRLGGESTIVGITDRPDGSVDLVAQAPLESPF
jgi:hypothetical protein